MNIFAKDSIKAKGFSRTADAMCAADAMHITSSQRTTNATRATSSQRSAAREKLSGKGGRVGAWLRRRREIRTKQRRSKLSRMKSTRILPLSFLLAIALGTLLLMLPQASATGHSQGFVTALFTATTSVCVTGLVVVDTYAAWSLLGKIIILLLIQIGGLGIVAMISFLMILADRRLSLSNTALLQDSFGLGSTVGISAFLRHVLTGTLLVEAVGALLYMLRFIPQFGIARGIWYSVFTSISAFCNAGIDILGPSSLATYSADPLVLCTTMALIIIGGLGFIVWFDLISVLKDGRHTHRSPHQLVQHLRAHTKLVLASTALLIAVGAVLIFSFEYSNPETLGTMTLRQAVLNSFFQSVSFRTAGFASFPQQGLRDVSCLVGLILMFVGGSPMGAAGGVKTVTMFAVLASAVAYIRGRSETVVFGRKISQENVRKATAIIMVSLLLNIVLCALVMAVEGSGLTNTAYEVFSATATVGLSRAMTPTLSVAGKLLISLGMYLGRIGPISMAIFFAGRHEKENSLCYPEGKFFVG